MNNKESLIISIIRYAPIIFVPIVLALVILFMYTNQQQKFIEENELIETQYITNEKERIKTEALTVLRYLKKDEEQHFQKLKGTLQQSVDNGHAAIVNIYKEYKNHKSKEEILQIVKAALRNIHPQKHNRYFFVYTLDGTNILHPALPHLENKDLWGFKDAKGTFLLQEMHKILSTKDSTYYSWYWRKPSDPSKKEYKKLGYFKKIKELDCFIGLGIYVDDFKQDIKNNALKYISNLRYKNDGFISIIDYDGNIISHPSKRVSGQNILTSKKFQKSDTKKHFQILDKNRHIKDKFVQFSVKVASSKKHGKKRIMYTKRFDEWGWYINHSFNLDEINQIIAERKKLLEEYHKEYIVKLFIYAFIFAIILLLIGQYISKRLIKVFIQYKEQLEEQKKEVLQLSQQYANFIEDLGENFVAYRHDLNGVLQYVSKNCNNVFGTTMESVVGQSFATQIDWTKNSLEIANDTINKLATKEKSNIQIQMSFIHPITHEERILKVTSHGQKNTQDDVIAIEGIVEDITEQVNINNIIKEQKEEFESIFRSSKDGIAILDLESRFLDCNQAYLDMLGFTLDEIKKHTCISLTAPEYKDKSIAALSTAIEKGGLENFEKVCLTKDGRRVHINMTSTLLPDKKRFLAVTKNVTALKHIEEQSRLASMGEMIGNIAHQWRQPLSMISTISTGVIFHKDMGSLSDELIEKEMNVINDNAQYLSQTIDDFRDFIKGDTKFSNISMADVVNGALTIVGPAIKNHYIEVILDIDESLMVNGNKNELEQVIINIANNSKDIIAEKNIEDGVISIKTEIIDKNTFNLIICDNGGGIPEDILPKIFDPYFTTKHQSKGTGLGLSMAEKIIRERHQQTILAHNDEIEFNGEKYKGACFTISFTTDSMVN